MQTLVLIAGAWLLGSINSAILLCRLTGCGDPRAAGSHNPGATNVYRIAGVTLALLTLVLDIAKGALPVLLGLVLAISPAALAWVALAAVAGHCYPLFFGFRGGKGVATALGALLALWPLMAVGLVLLWSVVFLLWRYSSLASVICALLLPPLTLVWHPDYWLFALLLSLLLCWRHRDNLLRLRQHAEPRIKKEN